MRDSKNTVPGIDKKKFENDINTADFVIYNLYFAFFHRRHHQLHSTQLVT